MVERDHPELKVEKLDRIIEPMLVMIKKLPPLEHYDTLIGDDISARIPTLIMRQVINYYRHINCLSPIKTVFIVGGESLKPQIVDERQAFFNQYGSTWGKTLYLTEYVEMGVGTKQMADALDIAGIDYDLATLSIAFDPKNSTLPIASQIHYGEIGHLGAVLHHDVRLAGVAKYDHLASWIMSQETAWPFGLCASRRQSLQTSNHREAWTSAEIARWKNQVEVAHRLAHSVIDIDSRYAPPPSNAENNRFLDARKDVDTIATQLINRLSL